MYYVCIIYVLCMYDICGRARLQVWGRSVHEKAPFRVLKVARSLVQVFFSNVDRCVDICSAITFSIDEIVR